MVSVIIPTCDRRELLGLCVRSVLSQSLPPDEILVVDNAPPGGARVPAGAFPSQVRVLREERVGVSHARNLGIDHARGDILAFIDDDAQAHPEWLSRIVSCLEGTGAAGVGGPTVPVWEAPPPRYLLDSPKALSYIGVFSLGDERRRLAESRDFLIGTNCAFRRTVFDEGHRFRFITLGRPLRVGEDWEFSRRIAGRYPVFYDPGVIVNHLIPAHKAKLGYLAWTGFENGRMKAAIGRPLSPRGLRDVWGVDGWISLFSASGYCYGTSYKVLCGP
jgi:glycosyltransferase involved in cell wall biosynthesis